MVALTCKPSTEEEMDRSLGLPSQSAWPPWRASGGPQLRNDTQGCPPTFTCPHTQQVLETHTYTACTCTTRNTHSKIHCLGCPDWSIKKKLLDQCTQSYHHDYSHDAERPLHYFLQTPLHEPCASPWHSAPGGQLSGFCFCNSTYLFYTITQRESHFMRPCESAPSLSWWAVLKVNLPQSRMN